MKTLISYVALTVFVLASSFTIDVQENLNHKSATYNCFSFLRAHRAGKAAVGLSWSVSSNDIVQFVVERSYDSEYFESAGDVTFNNSASYKFTDNNVYPGYIWYRVTAVKADGTTECSPLEQIRIVQRK
jgi:hypothetical protein